MSKQAYHEIMREFGPYILPSWHPQTQFVRKVAEKLIRGIFFTLTCDSQWNDSSRLGSSCD